MKNGYVIGGIAGAIAGFVDGIVSFIVTLIGGEIGLWEYAPTDFSILSLLIDFPAQTSLNILWGVVFGFAFVIVYDSIPRKGVMKGIIYGLIFYFLLSNIRIVSFLQSYGLYDIALGGAVNGFFASIAYGSVLGYLYKKE